MAAPNIVNVTSIFGRTASLTPANTTANVLLANPADSNKVFKVNMVIAANVSGSTANATVAINTAANGSGTSTSVVPTIVTPPNASLIGIDKSTSFYLEENRSIVVTSSAANALAFTVSYEDIN